MQIITKSLIVPVLVLRCVTEVSLGADYRITLPAFSKDRAGQVATFTLPLDAPQPSELRDDSGGTLPLQSEADGSSRFIVPFQPAGAESTFLLVRGRAPVTETVKAEPYEGDLRLSIAGLPVLAFRMDRERLPRDDIRPEFKRAGYVHPVLSPAGRIVTDDYPSNHVHHHGIWTSWVKTSFQGRAPDFWNMQTKTGAEDLIALDRSWSGPVHGGFSARLKMVDLSAPKTVIALNETWELTVFNLVDARRPVRMFDLAVTQDCATADPIILPTYHYGGFGFRGLGAWNGPGEAARFLTSEGFTDRIKGNNTRARWCYLGGPVEGGATAGTVTMGHPQNFRSPQPVRLHPNMPYFSFVPQQLGEFRIEPGQPYKARFRFIVLDGDPEKELVEAYWNGYESPSVPKLERL